MTFLLTRLEQLLNKLTQTRATADYALTIVLQSLLLRATIAVSFIELYPLQKVLAVTTMIFWMVLVR